MLCDIRLLQETTKVCMDIIIIHMTGDGCKSTHPCWDLIAIENNICFDFLHVHIQSWIESKYLLETVADEGDVL